MLLFSNTPPPPKHTRSHTHNRNWYNGECCEDSCRERTNCCWQTSFYNHWPSYKAERVSSYQVNDDWRPVGTLPFFFFVQLTDMFLYFSGENGWRGFSDVHRLYIQEAIKLLEFFSSWPIRGLFTPKLIRF